MNGFKTAMFMTVLTLILVFMGRAVGGPNGMAMALVLAAVMNLGTYWFSDKIVLSMYGAREVGPTEAPELHGIVRELAARARLPMPKVYIIESDTPNAFATGRNPEHAAVAATTGILRILDRNELMGVMAHEMTHVMNRDILIGSIAATFAGAISWLAQMVQWGAFFGGGRDNDGEGGGSFIGSILFSIVATLAAMLVQMAISRSREYMADEGGARLAGHPRYLANALMKLERGVQQVPMDANPATAHMFIVNPLRGDGVMNLFSTHPPMEDRIRRLYAMESSIRRR
jgi:heat shock protein HtpX